MIDLNLAKTDEEREILSMIVNSRTGELRVTKPRVDKSNYVTGRAYYVWRNIMFFISRNPQHHCLPIGSDLYLSHRDWKNRNQVIKELDAFVDRIVDSFPKTEWRGVARWSAAIYG